MLSVSRQCWIRRCWPEASVQLGGPPASYPSGHFCRIGEVAYSVARAGFSPSSEPAVRLSAQRALHHIFRLFP